MTNLATKLPVRTENKTVPQTSLPWHPLETLRQGIDRLFDDFDGGFRDLMPRSMFDLAPLRRFEASFRMPAVDISDRVSEYEISAELPGMDEKNIEVSLVDGGLLIKGEKKDEKEENKKNYFRSERHYGSFQRYFSLPEGVIANKIEAKFKNGVLTITVPKSPQAKKQDKKIPVIAA